MNEWISVKDQLPHGQKVLGYSPNIEEILIVYHDGESWWHVSYEDFNMSSILIEDFEITHWQPLKPPEGKKLIEYFGVNPNEK